MEDLNTEPFFFITDFIIILFTTPRVKRKICYLLISYTLITSCAQAGTDFTSMRKTFRSNPLACRLNTSHLLRFK